MLSPMAGVMPAFWIIPHHYWRAVMIRIRQAALAAILAGTIGSGVAFAQTKDTKSDAKSDTSTVTEVKNWTTKQWAAMTKEWAKDKAKWADCRKQSAAKKLSGRESWSFLYECMKKT
jgi:hypothetical protein